MKKILALSFLLFLCATTLFSQGQFSIKGQISDIPEGTQIELFRRSENNQGSIAESTITNGRFELEGTTDKAIEKVTISVYKNKVPFYALDIWIAPNTMTTVKGEGFFVATWDIESTVKEQLELNRYTAINKDDLRTQQVYIEQLMEVMSKLRATKKDEQGAELRKQYDSISNRIKPLSKQIAEKEIELLKKSEPSLIWLEKLTTQAYFVKDSSYPIDIKTLQELFSKLSDQDKASPEAEALKAAIFPPEQDLIGRKAIDANMTDLDGNYKRLADYQGKYVLIDFWASWCGPCLAAIPEMREIETGFKDNLTIVGINLDGNDDVWKKASENHKITWVNLTEGKQFGDGLHGHYKGQGIPYYVLLSPQGIVLDIWSGYKKGIIGEKLAKYIK